MTEVATFEATLVAIAIAPNEAQRALTFHVDFEEHGGSNFVIHVDAGKASGLQLGAKARLTFSI